MRRWIGLCVPPLVFWAFDGTITLLGQSTLYWAGDYTAVNETSPTFRHLLQLHPAAYAVGIVVWAAVFVGLIGLLPDTLALIVSLAVTFGHTVGVATWLLYRFRYGYQVCNGLFLMSAVLLGVGIRVAWGAAPAPTGCVSAWPPAVRWGLAAVLFAAGAYLFVWPRSA